jgi:GDP-D-mannose 3', 5'-epimerase
MRILYRNYFSQQNMPPTSLVLGAGGFIGGHLTDALMADGHDTYGADIQVGNSRAKMTIGDLRDAGFVDSLFASIPNLEHVYQLAADMGGATYINCGLHDADVMSNSVVINVNVARACVKYGVKRLFFSSSACVYPATGNVATCREEDVYPAFPDNEYGWEKLFTERMLRNFQRQHGLVVRIARFHSIVGDRAQWTGGKEKAHSALARKIALAAPGDEIEVIGNGKQLRTFLYVKDCVRGIRTLMDSDCEEPINIGSDVTISIDEYVHLLQKISGKAITIRHVPGPTGVHQRFCDISKAKKMIQWSPTVSLEDATRITYDWIAGQIQQGHHD